MTWHLGPVLGFDTETSGVDVENDRIVTAALVYYAPGAEHTTRTWLSDVDGMSIPAQATAVHGVTNEQAKADGRRAIEVVGEVAQALAEHMATGAPVVAMNARFDFTILDRELRRHGLSTLEVLLGRPVGPVVDPLIIDRQADKYRKGKRTLDALCAHYEVVLENAHTADADALASVQVAIAQAEKYPELQALDALHQWQIGWAAAQAASLQEFKRRTDPTIVIEGAWPLIPYQPAAPHQPRRDDAVATWLKAQRDAQTDGYGQPPAWHVLDGLLDRYRLHADTGTPLNEHVCEGRVVGDCPCFEQPVGGAR